MNLLKINKFLFFPLGFDDYNRYLHFIEKNSVMEDSVHGPLVSGSRLLKPELLSTLVVECPRASKCSFVDIVFDYLNGAQQFGVKMRSLIRRHGYHWPGIAKSLNILC
ncbi:hypothetical protein E5676_scaffold1274G00060 [Cucumis melo var. makuwa]|uniref:Uncharacterized protein n=1 Tax=Cucumis melo var. makuwa TaxID=1194695 RepID=A0A5D3D7P0_CUCMM|nr:hypothetical protein E5676_scaffold1274G00060 [Cucumis melo var. makuwa]